MMDVWVEEFVVFQNYRRLRAHVRPSGLPIESVSLILNGVSFPVAFAVVKDERHGDFIELALDVLSDKTAPVETKLEILLKDGRVERIADIAGRQMARDPFRAFWLRAEASIASRVAGMDVLEIASRRRDQTDDVFDALANARSYVGTDILAGSNVDVVCDVHRLADHVPREAFDLVYSQWGFEHFANPFAVATEINKVLRVGGEAVILSNQTVGLHDLPFDFWRFSTSAWRAVFNEQTGFEIIDTAMGEQVQICPRRYRHGWEGHEGSIGCAASGVWARKIADRPLEWPVRAADCIAKLGQYPEQLRDA